MFDLAVGVHADNARENAPDSVKPWGIWPPLSSHRFHAVKTLLNAWRLLDFRARGDF